MNSSEFLAHFSGVRKSGGNEWVAKCPAHQDKNGSLHFTEKNGRLMLHCFAGCNFRQIIQAAGLQFSDVPGCQEKPRWHYGCTLAEYGHSKGYDIAKLMEFGCSDGQATTLKGKPYSLVNMPYLAEDGKTVLKMRQRVLAEKDPKGQYAKFKWVKDDQPLQLYGLWRQPEARDCVVIVEGESDCHALWSAGINALGVPGASNYNAERMEPTLKQYGRIYVHLEKDSGGQTLYRRFTDPEFVSQELLEKMRFFCLPKGVKDPSDAWAQSGANVEKFKEIVRGAIGRAKPSTSFIEPGEWKGKQRNTKGLSDMKDRRAETSRENGKAGAEYGQLGGRPHAEYGLLADAFYRDVLTKDGKAIYRYWRNGWYRFNGRCFKPFASEVDFQALIFQYISKPGIYDAFRVMSTTTTAKNVEANLTVNGKCLVDADAKMGTWLNDMSDASGWLAMSNTVVNVETAAQMPAILAEDGRTEPTEEEKATYLRPLSPDLLTTYAMDYDFDPKAECPKFMAWLESTIPDQETQEAIQMLMGLSLVNDTSYNVCFFLEGEAGCGKSTFLKLLEGLVGRQNICHVSLLDFAEKFATWPLAENLLNIVGELPTSDPQGKLRYIEGKFKESVSGEDVHVEKKGRDAGSAPCMARHIFACNALPIFFDKTEAIWDRLRIIHFGTRFRGSASEVKNIAQEIVKEELPGMFNFALAGLSMLRQRNTFPESQAMAEAKAVHRNKCDVEGSYLRRFYYEDNGPMGWLSGDSAYFDFKKYLAKNGFASRSSRALKDALKNTFPNVWIEERGEHDVWHGIRCNKDLVEGEPF